MWVPGGHLDHEQQIDVSTSLPERSLCLAVAQVDMMPHAGSTCKQCSAECHCLLQEALWRVAAFADAGADVLFIDALESREEMSALCSAGGSAASLPKVCSHACESLSSADLLASLFTLHLWLSRIQGIRLADWTDICRMLQNTEHSRMHTSATSHPQHADSDDGGQASSGTGAL